MSPQQLFRRKLGYLLMIGVLALLLLWMGQPATSATKGAKDSPGGVLARLRSHYRLSQAELGDIDPTSVTIKLSTLGLRGIAANILWAKATDYQMRKDWANRAAVLKQITKVQPNFINVWINQAWNVSYNIAVQFRDDYRERYRWIIKGFDFLKEGMVYNRREPRLQYELGRMVSQKIGKADESKQYRRLFKQDDDFNAGVELALRDNWLVGRKWYELAINMVETMGVTMMGQSPLIYRSSGPLCLMSYADAIERDGTFGEVAQTAWVNASEDWRRFGNFELPTSFMLDDKPVLIRLNEQEQEEAESRKLVAQLEAIEPGLRDKIIAEKKASLTKAQREAMDIPSEKRTPKQLGLAYQAELAVATTHDELARRITGPNRKKAIELARKAAEHDQIAQTIRSNRMVVNFDYWRSHAKTEQSGQVLTARKLVYQADRKAAEGELTAARDAYRDGFRAWRRVIDAYPDYLMEQTANEDLVDAIQRYHRTLSQLDEKFPKPFILQDVIDQYRRQHQEVQDEAPAKTKKPAPKKAK
ncbi:MAG: hypothetical protein ABFC63_05695 [Thermoguttaceae bacterium]